jgi:rubredoxin
MQKKEQKVKLGHFGWIEENGNPSNDRNSGTEKSFNDISILGICKEVSVLK